MIGRTLVAWGVTTLVVKFLTTLVQHPIGWPGAAIIAGALVVGGVIIFVGDFNIGSDD